MPPETARQARQSITPAQFQTVQKLANRAFGLELRPGKEGLVAARLGRRVRELGLATIGEYLSHVRLDASGEELTRLVDTLTTNCTSFLRESAHFDLLRSRILPELGQRSEFHIWSAGCATGEEPYSILCVAAEIKRWAPGQSRLGGLKLLATDISHRALETARAGIYPEPRLAGMPPHWQKYFQRGQEAWAGSMRVRPELRRMVEFRRLNLMEPFERVAPCAVIFCRNVMIYFDKPTQERLVQRFEQQLEPGGWLLIGHSEGLMGVRHRLEYVMPAVYRKSN